MRSDSLRRTAAAATELLNANHEMKASAAPQRTRGMVNTSHGRVKETPLDCKRTLPRAYSSGVSARPRPPRHARSGPNSPPLRDVPASGAARPTGLDLQNHRWRGARAACCDPVTLLALCLRHQKGCLRRPPRALIAAEPRRGRRAPPKRTAAANAAQNDPDLVLQRQQQQPRAAKKGLKP